MWDGSVLCQHSVEDGFFSRKENLALPLNTDGVPLFKSSLWSLWPVFLTIYNLPPTIRMKAENVLLCGLVRAKTVVGIFDLPAKAAVLCMKQFNREYGVCSMHSPQTEACKWSSHLPSPEAHRADTPGNDKCSHSSTAGQPHCRRSESQISSGPICGPSVVHSSGLYACCTGRGCPNAHENLVRVKPPS